MAERSRSQIWGRCWHYILMLSVSIVVMITHKASPHLNLYLTRPEVRRLFGLDAELFYVREGVINSYALNFTVPIPANLSRLFFTWQGLMKRPMQYLAQIEYDNGEAMALPTLNITAKGTVPTEISTFALTLPCSGAADAEVQVNLHLNVTSLSKNLESNVTHLTIRRKKICYKGETFLPRNESIYQRPTWAKTPLSTLYVAMGVACTATVLIITLAALIYLKIKRARESQSLNCRYYSGPSYLGVDNSSTMGGLRVPGGGNSSMKSNSYATIPSLRKYPLPSSPKHEALNYNGVGSSSYVGSLHYASSPLSHLYSQMPSEGCSPSHSLLNSRLSHSSWCSPNSLRSQSTWRDPRQTDPTDRIRQLTVDRWRVVVGDLLQEGTFGRIHQGVCHDPLTQKGLNVIVKTVSGDSSSAQARLVLREGLLLSGLHHPNLLSVLGVCTQDLRRPLLLYPHDDQTNLKLYLRGGANKSGVSYEGGKKLLTRDAVQVAIGVCQGLMLLHQHKILHKDVSTRNCVVSKDLQVKITDTALSRDLFPQDYHCLGDNENRPIKWLSLEAVLHNRFTAASDVWMFGVLLWELMTSAQQPYVEIDPFEMAAYLRDGYRLSQPHSCPDDLFGVMAICWAPSPDDRPSLASLNSCLQEFHSALSTFV